MNVCSLHPVSVITFEHRDPDLACMTGVSRSANGVVIENEFDQRSLTAVPGNTLGHDVNRFKLGAVLLAHDLGTLGLFMLFSHCQC